MPRKRVVVLGAGFAGFTVALELKKVLAARHEVIVISKQDQFVFSPSLVAVPFGLCAAQDLQFPLRGPLEAAGVRYHDAAVTGVNVEQGTVTTKSGSEHYDCLVVATGAEPNFRAIPGFGPRGYTQSIESLGDAQRAAVALQKLLKAPGPIVVGAVHGAPRVDAAYEVLFNVIHWLRKHGLLSSCPVTLLTPENTLFEATRSPFVATELRKVLAQVAIQVVTAAQVRQVRPSEIALSDGRVLPFAFALLMPSYLGSEAMQACERLTDARGFVRVNEFFQSPDYPQVFALGAAAAVRGELGKSPTLIEGTARLVARNVAALVEDQPLRDTLPPPPSDANAGFSEGPWHGRPLACHHYLQEHAATLSQQRDTLSPTGR
jgi:sulfide:quinone oxidoreductase